MAHDNKNPENIYGLETLVQLVTLPIMNLECLKPKNVFSKVKIGDGHSMNITLLGKKCYTIIQENGETYDVTLNIKYVPNLWCNLISITTLVANRFEIGNKGKMVTISREDTQICFDHIQHNQLGGGFMMGVEMIPRITPIMHSHP